jgi:acyl-CoA thioesterase-1
VVNRLLLLTCTLVILVLDQAASGPFERTVRIAVLGDSLVAGFGISEEDAFPSKLQRVLNAKGILAEVMNAGVSGDTAWAGLARLDRSVPEGTDAVILELGTNDAGRGIPPEMTRATLQEIVQRLRRRDIEVLICGIWAKREGDGNHADAFNAIFAEVAGKSGLIFYPYFLEGVGGNPKFTLDGLHPNPAGVAEIVARILPKVEELVARVRTRLNTRLPN